MLPAQEGTAVSDRSRSLPVRPNLKSNSRSAATKRRLRLITIPDAAVYLNISGERLYQLARQSWAKDPFPAFKIRGAWYVDSDEIVDWLARLLDRGQVLGFSGGGVTRRRVCAQGAPASGKKRRPRRRA